MKFKKSDVITALIQKTQTEIAVLQAAVQAAHEATTHAESKAEDSHDTRAIEASYLTAGQTKRLMELNRIQNQLQILLREAPKNHTIVQPGSLCLIEEEKKRSWYFIHTEGGGISAEFSDENGATINIQILTPRSVLGEAVMGLNVGDEAEIEVKDEMRSLKILQIDSDATTQI